MPMIERGRPLRVLAVEDNNELREFYGTILREEGHQVRLARNSLEAMHHLDWEPQPWVQVPPP